MESRDLKIIRHIGLYSISIRPILERLFFDGRPCGNVMHRLIHAEGCVQSRDGLSGTRSYYQLTKRGTTLLGLPDSRAERLGPQALPKHLAILWFCFMGKKRRFRLERERVEELLGSDAPPGDYCLEEGETPRLYIVHVLGKKTRVSSVLRMLRNNIDRARKSALASDWLIARGFGFVVLVGTPERAKILRDAVSRSRDDGRSLHEQAYVHVAVAPGPETLKEALRAAEE